MEQCPKLVLDIILLPSEIYKKGNQFLNTLHLFLKIEIEVKEESTHDKVKR